jgi:hypothetical protein
LTKSLAKFKEAFTKPYNISLACGHVRKGSRLRVIGHIQQRTTRNGDLIFVFEVIAGWV